MLGTSSSEWLLIRVSIIACRYTPLLYASLICCVFSWYGQAARSLIFTWILLTLSVAEALFYVFIYRQYELRLQEAAVHPPPLTRRERKKLFEKCLANVPSPEAYLRGWFLGAETDDIRLDNVKEFLLWAFFDGEKAGSSSEATLEELDNYIAKLEKRLGRELEPGRGPAKSLRLTVDDIHTTYRSLPWYAVVFFLDQLTHLAFRWHGFEYYAQSPASTDTVFPPRPQSYMTRRKSPAASLTYWHRPHRARDKVPVVFFHGIGVGLWVYTRFLADINPATVGRGQDDIGLIAVEIMPISFRLTSAPLGKVEFLEQMVAILDHHRWDRFAVASHSYGSVLTTHVLSCTALQHRVVSVFQIDPVTIMLHLPDVAFNFTRRRPRRANEWQLWYFASTDPGVAHCLGRHFFWRNNIIWREDMLHVRSADPLPDRRVAVCLSGRDLIVDVPSVAQYLTARGKIGKSTRRLSRQDDAIEVYIHQDLDHAQVFDQDRDRRHLAELVRSYCDLILA